MRRILLTQAIHPQAERRLAALGEVITAADTRADTLRRSAQGCNVIVVRAPLPDDIFAAAPSLIGAVRHGAGVDMIPVEAASAQGVLVANVPGVNAVSVAEHVVLKLLQFARHSDAIDARLRAARTQEGWHAARGLADSGFDLAGRTVGLVGHGHVGQAISRICAQGLSMRVLAYTRHGTRPEATPWVESSTSLAALLAQCDFVVLACPLNDQTRGLIGAAELAQMRRGAFLVNVARGPVVQTEALLAALRNGQLGGAALDVFDVQPLPDDHPLWAMGNVLLTPHIAGITDDSMRRMGEGAALAVASLLRGEVPANCVNPGAESAFRQRFAAVAAR